MAFNMPTTRRTSATGVGRGRWTRSTTATRTRCYLLHAGGQKLGAYQFNIVQTSPTPTMYVTLMTSDRYFGGKRLAQQDRLGSAGDFYPWGEAKGGNNPADTWSYATYWRDSASGLDYANNRYYSNAYGRFMTPDPSSANNDPKNPGSWNHYAYALGDPIRHFDPTGLVPKVTCGDVETGPEEDDCIYDQSSCLILIDGQLNPLCGNDRATVAQAGAIRFGSFDFDLAKSALNAELSTIFGLFSIGGETSQCETDLALVGVTDEQVSAAAASANIINGLTSSATYAQAIFGNSPAYSAAEAQYGNTTMQVFMLRGLLTGVAAVSQSPGNNIYIDAGWINGMTTSQQQALLLHELLHNITGQDDSTLQSDLGLPTNARSQNIGDKLEKDCVP